MRFTPRQDESFGFVPALVEMHPMTKSKFPYRRFFNLVWLFIRSEIFWPSVAMFVVILALISAQNLINLTNADVLGKLTTALQRQESSPFWRFLALYVIWFLLLSIATGCKQFVEERLGLLLRAGLTRHLIERFLGDRAYLRLADRPDIDNPDQRITEDVKTLTTNTLAFVIILIMSGLNLVTFSQKLSDIAPRLVWAAFGYAAVGTILTIVVGKRLVWLNYLQYKKEADLRFELVKTREHGEAIAIQHDERRLVPRLFGRLNVLIENMKSIIFRNAMLAQLTNFYNSLIEWAVPMLILAPIYFASKDMEFGVFATSAFAFRIVVNSISVIVTEFPRLTQITATVARLSQLRGAMEEITATNGIEIRPTPNFLGVEHLTLLDPADSHHFVSDLNFEVQPGKHLLVVGPAGSGKSELMRALAGVWREGNGRISRPPLDQIAFVPPQAYITPNTLRNLLVQDRMDSTPADDMRLKEALAVVGLTPVLERVGGLDIEKDWSLLPLGERQALMLAELVLTPPRYAVLDEATSTLDSRTRTEFYLRLARAGTTFITLSAHPVLPDFHKQRLDLTLTSDWRLTPIPA